MSLFPSNLNATSLHDYEPICYMMGHVIPP